MQSPFFFVAVVTELQSFAETMRITFQKVPRANQDLPTRPAFEESPRGAVFCERETGRSPIVYKLIDYKKFNTSRLVRRTQWNHFEAVPRD